MAPSQHSSPLSFSVELTPSPSAGMGATLVYSSCCNRQLRLGLYRWCSHALPWPDSYLVHEWALYDILMLIWHGL